jgi:hypothetical protein
LNWIQLQQESQLHELPHCMIGPAAALAHSARHEFAPQSIWAAVHVSGPLHDSPHGPRLPQSTVSVAQLSVPAQSTWQRKSAGHSIRASVQAVPPRQLTSQ